MATRKQLIEDILNNFYTLRHAMKIGSIRPGQTKITPSQWFVLGLIRHHGGTTNIRDIAKTLRMSSSAATQLVDGLTKSGYVARQASPADRRLVEIVLSSKGKKHIAAMKEQRMRQMAKLFKALNDEELATYSRLHKKLISRSLSKTKK